MSTPEYMTTPALRARGWTPSMIARFLGREDDTKPNPKYRSAAPMKLYLTDRVTATEASPEFDEARARGAERRAAAMLAAHDRSRALIENAKNYAPSLPGSIDLAAITVSAIAAYNAYHEDRRASACDSPEFLARITFNFVRHDLTDWDETWASYEGQPGVRDAYRAAAAQLARAVSCLCPELRAAAEEWLGRK